MKIIKGVLLSSLSFASVLILGNWSGAIAQSQRYPTDSELDSLFTRFAKSIQWNENDKVGRGYVRDRRTDVQKESLNSFIRSWSVGNSEIAPFVGSWQGYEDQITIYPSNTKNRVCIISTGEGRGRFYLGNISKGKIYTNNNTVLFRQGRYLGDAVVINGEPRLLGELPHNSPRPLEQIEEFVNSRVRPQYRPEIIIQKYLDAGCTVNLPNNIPKTSTQSSQKKCLLFTGNGWANVYETLSDAKSPSGIRRFSFTLGFNDMVEILGIDEQNRYLRVTPVQGRFGNVEKINNMFGWLDGVRNRALEQVSCPVKYTTTPSPSSSTPVRPTDTIAKYPTNDDFNAFEDKLQGNPKDLVKLRGNQAEQRRKFQNDWKPRNPNAAKFLGAWYTGDRYFYVFPATAKGGTCVVTQDANGKLNMQVGTVLNKELRYGGGKGFFWRDRENTIASRDSGSGSLYPIYATSEMPELSDSMIGDMERQRCITTLPFEADAQYYKERGDKFVKLGNKDEAISNYRKALELFRKQNQFTQAKAIESQIVKLGGSIK